MPKHGNNMPNEKPKDFKKAIKMLLNYCRPYIKYFVIAAIFAFLSSIGSLYGPGKLKDMTDIITDGFMTGIDLDSIKSIGIILIVVYGLSWFLQFGEEFILATVTNKFAYKLRSEISSKINKLPLKYFDKHSYGDILSRITNDVDTLGQSLNNSVGSLVSAISLFVGCIIMMFITSPLMAITAIVSSILGFIFMALILSKSQKYFNMQQEQLGMINGHIEELYSSLNIVKAYNGKEEAVKEFDEINNKLFISGKKSQFLSGLMMPLMSFIGNFGYVCVCIVGALLVMNDSITFGVIVAFMIYVRLFTSPLSTIGQSFAQLQSMAAASERVFNFLGEEEMISEENIKSSIKEEDLKGTITFENVKFGYDEDLVIKDFSCKVKKGQKIAIVGPTGAGKTTLVNLLMKFYDVNEGNIYIDDVEYRNLKRENIHDLFVMVLQDTWLFNGSIKENIVYNKENISDEEVINACKTVGLDHFIRSLPKGYDTILNEVDNLSAGQKQLLTIARSMISSAPFLILDEATSNVDTRTEELVAKAMDKLSKGRTSFIIAHRLSTIKNADLILVMNEGNIVEQGTHEELLNKKGFYADIYNSQFEKV